MKKFLAVFLTVVMLLAGSVSVSAATYDHVPEDVMALAEKTAQSMKTLLGGDPAMWGLESREQAADLELGSGYYVHYMLGDKIETATGDTVDELVSTEIIPHWRFVMELDGVPMTYFTISKETKDATEWKRVGYGGLTDEYAAAQMQAEHLAKEANTVPVLLTLNGNMYFAIGDDGYVLPAFAPPEEENTISRSSAKTIAYFDSVHSFATELKEACREQQANASGETGRGAGIYAYPTTYLAVEESDPPYWMIATILMISGAGIVLVAIWLYKKKKTMI